MFVGLCAIIGCIRQETAVQAQPTVSVTVTELPAGSIEILLDFSQAADTVRFGPASTQERWPPGNSVFDFTWPAAFERRAASGLTLARRDGERFRQLRLVLSPSRQPPGADYTPLLALGAENRVLFTGAIWPWAGPNNRMAASFRFHPGEGRIAHAFGEPIINGADWQSPYRHPAFVRFTDRVVGRMADQDDRLVLYTGPDLPGWARTHAEALVDGARGWLPTALGADLEGPVDVMIMARIDENDPLGAQQYRFSGDALPGQLLMVLDGISWHRETGVASDILNRSIVHELVHLWQAQVRPADDTVPARDHEGAAEAITAEALVALGVWKPEEKARFDRRAVADCDTGLRGLRLEALRKASAFRTVYACGHALSLRAAERSQQDAFPVSAFWKRYLRRARAEDGQYSLATWLETVEAWSGDPDRDAAFSRFVATPWARPRRALDELHLVSTNAAGIDNSAR